jgi:hypothetical protein
MNCKNCAVEFEGNYCPNCGQNSGVMRFTYPYFLRETFFSSLDIEHGFTYSLKALFLRPGNAIRDYLQGKRLSLTVPGKYLILMGAISTFLAVQYEIFKVPEISEKLMWLPDVAGFFKFAAQYTTVINIITIPIFAFFSWIIFRNKGYNYAENTILNIFITSQQLLMLVILVPLVSLFETMNSELVSCYTIITIIYNVWVYLQFFKLKIVSGTLLSLAAILLSYAGQFFFNYFIYTILPQQWIEYLAFITL